MAGGPYKTTNGWQIKWRINGVWQSETFALEHEAHHFKYLVERDGNVWPPGWIRGHGFVVCNERTGATVEVPHSAPRAV
jgi:hypothetical protein